MLYFKNILKFQLKKFTNKSTLEISAIKTRAINSFSKKINTDNSRENELARNIIDNPDRMIKINERDIHLAIKKSGGLPEDDLKYIIENNNFHELDNFLSKLSSFLNASLVEITRIVKNNEIMRRNETFWKKMEEELENRVNSLSNEQITDLISLFSKSEVKSLKFFNTFEDVVIDSTIPFLPDQIEKIFISFCDIKAGSTALLKHLSKSYFKNREYIDIVKLAKFATVLNKHPQTTRGNFGLINGLEEIIIRDAEKLEFTKLLKVSEYVFSENICSNKIHSLLEDCIIKKFEKKIKIDLMKIIKLLKSTSNYFIKKELLCFKLKNHIETYLNGYIAKETNLNEETIDTNVNINIEFAENYGKLISNISLVIWSISKNQTFVRLAENPEFDYFYSRLKDVFIKNISFYNERETVYAIDGLLKLRCIFDKDQVDEINKKILSLSKFSPHDSVKLLNEIVRKKIASTEVIEKLIKNVDIKKLSYGDLIDYTDFISGISYTREVYDDNKLKIYEDRLIKVLPIIEMSQYSKILKLSQNIKFSEDFNNKLIEVLALRVNEITKDNFCETLTYVVNLKLTDIFLIMVDILEDLSNFENITDIFNSSKDKINLLWSALSIIITLGKGNHKQKEFLSKYIDKCMNYLDNDSLCNLFDTSEFLYKTNDYPVYEYEVDLIRFIQTLYLASYYINEKNNTGDLIYENVYNNLNLVQIESSKRMNFINTDPTSMVDKNILKEIENEVVNFFKRKINASIYPNFIDELFNPFNIIILFEKPNLKPNEIVVGVDGKKFGIVIINKFHKSRNENMTFYDNRINILKNILKWEIICIDEEEWIKSEEKQTYLKKLFGFNFEKDEELIIRIEKVKEGNDKLEPKYGLAQKILSKKIKKD